MTASRRKLDLVAYITNGVVEKVCQLENTDVGSYQGLALTLLLLLCELCLVP